MKNTSPPILILLGSNQGDRAHSLAHAKHFITTSIGKIVSHSNIHHTTPWGVSNQPDFFNQIIEIQYDKDPHTLLKQLLSIEIQMGRTRPYKWAPRIIDLDILYFKNTIIHTPKLQLPHPGIAHRHFTLTLLVEKWASVVHPVLKENHQTLLASLLSKHINRKPASIKNELNKKISTQKIYTH